MKNFWEWLGKVVGIAIGTWLALFGSDCVHERFHLRRERECVERQECKNDGRSFGWELSSEEGFCWIVSINIGIVGEWQLETKVQDVDSLTLKFEKPTKGEFGRLLVCAVQKGKKTCASGWYKIDNQRLYADVKVPGKHNPRWYDIVSANDETLVLSDNGEIRTFKRNKL